MNKLLEVKNLTVTFPTDYGPVYALRGINFSLMEGETLAIVGESGCGKSVTAKALLRLLDPHAEIEADSIYLEDVNINLFTDRQMRRVRGNHIAMIFQDPMTSLNPTMRIGEQIMEGYRLHYPNTSRKEAYNHAIELLHLVNIPDPHLRIKQHPFELSGGMRQRAMIAIALAMNPKVLIADEPTTALDVTIQSQILHLLRDIQKKLSMSLIFITHDLSIVANFADRILVMYAGEIVEEGTTLELFQHPSHPYTKSLLNAIPRIDKGKDQKLYTIEGMPPNLMHKQTGCNFFNRCPYAMEICAKHTPPMFALPNGQASLCWLQDRRAKGIENEKTTATSAQPVPIL